MNNRNINFVKEFIRTNNKFISDEYIGKIIDFIIDDVIEDIEACANIEFNEDDIRLAVGRTILNKFNFEV